jgi:hypothetical protein
MSSLGAGSDISVQVLADLLHKLMTESTKVQANFTCSGCGVNSVVGGVLRLEAGGFCWIVERESEFGPVLRFDPSLAVRRTYGDERSMADSGESPFGFRFTSAICLVFGDDSRLMLFAVKEE